MFRMNCDHSRVVVASKSPEIVVYQPDRFSGYSDITVKLKGHSQPVVWVDFSPTDPDLLLSASYDQTIRVWDLSKLSRDGPESSAEIRCFAFNVKLKYAIFSPLAEHCLIVGTQSTPFYVFNMGEKSVDFPPSIATGKSPFIKYSIPNLLKHPQFIIVARQSVQDKAGTASSAPTTHNTQPSGKTESKVVDLKKTETTVFYLAKRESNKKVLQCLQAIVKADEDAAVGTEDAFLNKKLFSNDLDQIKDFLLQEGNNLIYISMHFA